MIIETVSAGKRVILAITRLLGDWKSTQKRHQYVFNALYFFSFFSYISYILSRMIHTKENEEIDTRKTTALTTVLTSLRKFSNYSIQVLGYTRMGDGVSSQAIFCKTEEDGEFNSMIISIRTYYVINQFVTHTHKQFRKLPATSKSWWAHQVDSTYHGWSRESQMASLHDTIST